MRHLMLALMIVLLPLRGWAGQTMALDMAAQQVMTASVGSATHHAVADTAMPPDCAMVTQGSASLETDTTDVSASGQHCDSCNSCQLCLTWAAVSHAVTPGPAFLPWAKSLAPVTRFLSANIAPDQKPPIS